MNSFRNTNCRKVVQFLIVTLITIAGFSQSKDYDPEHHYSVKELQSDFNFLRTKLEKIHPALYMYTPKEEFNLFFDSLYNSITKPLTEQEFYNIITLLNSKIKDGHTMMLPSDAARNYFNQKARFFPFYIVIANEKLYVNMNCSPDTSIKEGAEIESINGVDAKDILGQLLKRQIRDGENKTYPEWILTTYFKDYYGFSFGHPNTFSISYKNPLSDLQTATINALPRDSVRFYRQEKYHARIPATGEKQGITLDINDQPGVATLTIKSFDKALLKSEYNQDFKTEIGRMFEQIRDNNVQNLILDMRNNQGGDFEPGRYLLSWLIQQPIDYLKNSNEFRTITPLKNNFTGKLYVLINGGSFSNTGIVSSYLELTGRAIFIGEEAAGNKVVLSGDPGDGVLPNTKIAVQLSSKKYIIRDAVNEGHGVIPAHYIIPSVEDIINGRDPVKEFVINLILKN
ncbi:MAG: S41 family peptidase [Bacteroidota bacterium]